jgi:hypothetical protein
LEHWACITQIVLISRNEKLRHNRGRRSRRRHRTVKFGPEVPHQVSGFRGCGVLELYHANTPEIMIQKMPFWIKVVVTLVGHVGKSSHLVLVFTSVAPKKDSWLQVWKIPAGNRRAILTQGDIKNVP